ncbi:MAG: hypothetical protein AMXMBFR7_29210 [Planctomycetota bacterium]
MWICYCTRCESRVSQPDVAIGRARTVGCELLCFDCTQLRPSPKPRPSAWRRGSALRRRRATKVSIEPAPRRASRIFFYCFLAGACLGYFLPLTW